MVRCEVAFGLHGVQTCRRPLSRFDCLRSRRAVRRSAARSSAGSARPGIVISLVNMSKGESSTPMALPSDFDIFCTPSVPSMMGVIRTICGSWPASRCSLRPISRLNFWSVPPSSTSAVRRRDRIVPLRDGVKQLVERDGLFGSWKRAWKSSRSSICEAVTLAARRMMSAKPSLASHSEL